MELIYLIIGLVLGGFIVWLVMKLTGSGNQSNSDKISFLQGELENSRIELEQKSNSIIELSKELSAKNADFKNLAEKLIEQKEEINKLNEKFAIEFKNLANEILEEKSKKFTELNKENIDGILKPLQEKIKDFEKKVEETYDKEAQQRFSLKEEVKKLAELNQQIGKEANNLTKALKGDSKTQGNWGEIILENILEKSGLVKDREYYIQSSFTDETGRRLQPDVVIKYPGERNIIIDSKVSLTAYEKYNFVEEEKEKELAMKEHLISIRKHINELSDKSYQDIYQIQSIDFVIMFMPVEPAYLTAIRLDPELWNYAYEKRVLLISPTNLIAALKMIVSMWRQEYQNKNAQKIAETAGSLYDKFTLLMEDLINLGKKIEDSQSFYKSSMNKLSEGKGNVIKKVEELKELGAKTKKSLPENLLERAIDKH